METRQARSVEQLREAGLQFVFDQFPTADHLTLLGNDEWAPVAEFLGDHQVVRNPHRITYVVAPALDSARAG